MKLIVYVGLATVCQTCLFTPKHDGKRPLSISSVPILTPCTVFSTNWCSLLPER